MTWEMMVQCALDILREWEALSELKCDEPVWLEMQDELAARTDQLLELRTLHYFPKDYYYYRLTHRSFFGV